MKIENDGYTLGSQRSEREGSQLQEALTIAQSWQKGKKQEATFASWVTKKEIEESDVFDFRGDYYRVFDMNMSSFPIVELGDILDYEQPTQYIVESTDYNDSYFTPVLTAGKTFILGYTNEEKGIFRDFPVIIFDDFTTATKFVDFPFKVKSSAMKILKSDPAVADIRFIYYLMQNIQFDPGEHKRYWISQFSKIKIPLPPIKVQREIVAELDRYQKIIDGARQVVENYKPSFKIDPEWVVSQFGEQETLKIIDGDRGVNYPNKTEFTSEGYCLFLNTSNVRYGFFNFDKCDFINKEKDEALRKGKLERNDVVMTTRGTLGNTAFYSDDIEFANMRINSGMVILRPSKDVLSPEYLLEYLNSLHFSEQVTRFVSGSAQPQLPIGTLNKMDIPVPSLVEQGVIVQKLQTEKEQIKQTEKLISTFEEKIKDKISEVWGE
jgi:restriction endonuclease S subunit